MSFSRGFNAEGWKEKPPIERGAMSRWFESFQEPTAEEMALFDKPVLADVTLEA